MKIQKGKMVIRICDICKENDKVKEIDGPHRLIENMQFNKETRFWDLCPECMSNILSLLGKGTKIGQSK